MTDTSTAAANELPRRRVVEELSPEAWLLRIHAESPELIEEKDFRYLSSIAPASVLQACTERYLPMIYRQVLFPGSTARERGQRATGEAEFNAFIDLIYERYRTMTREQGLAEINIVAAIFQSLKPKQKLGEAMTRDQFGEKWIALRAAKARNSKQAA